ncbi:exonuclease [Vibrio phage D63]
MTQHSVYSFSGAHRWFEEACSASIRLTRGIPNTTNPAAELGTAAHELGEFCIKWGSHPKDCIGMTFNDHIVDEQMTDAVELYTGYANDLSIRTGCKPDLEKRVVMTSLGRTDVYGTSDFTLADYANRTLYVSDYKHGFGLVDVVNNKQLIAYAIATLDTLDQWAMFDKVVTTIIQPRRQHADGCIRSATYTTQELVNWQQRYARSIQLAEDPNTPAKAGAHCQYCPKVRCRTRFEYVLNLVAPDAPDDELTDKEVGIIYANREVITAFMTKIEGLQLQTTRKTGYVPEGYKPVKAIQRAKVEDEKGLLKAVEAENIDTRVLYEDKLKSKTALKKVLPAKILNKYFIVPPSSVSIAKMNDNRPAVNVGKASGVFTPVGGQSTNSVFTPIQ